MATGEAIKKLWDKIRSCSDACLISMFFHSMIALALGYCFSII